MVPGTSSFYFSNVPKPNPTGPAEYHTSAFQINPPGHPPGPSQPQPPPGTLTPPGPPTPPETFTFVPPDLPQPAGSTLPPQATTHFPHQHWPPVHPPATPSLPSPGSPPLHLPGSPQPEVFVPHHLQHLVKLMEPYLDKSPTPPPGTPAPASGKFSRSSER